MTKITCDVCKKEVLGVTLMHTQYQSKNITEACDKCLDKANKYNQKLLDELFEQKRRKVIIYIENISKENQ